MTKKRPTQERGAGSVPQKEVASTIHIFLAARYMRSRMLYVLTLVALAGVLFGIPAIAQNNNRLHGGSRIVSVRPSTQPAPAGKFFAYGIASIADVQTRLMVTAVTLSGMPAMRAATRDTLRASTGSMQHPKRTSSIMPGSISLTAELDRS